MGNIGSKGIQIMKKEEERDKDKGDGLAP